jgi:hypothetical protein
VFNVKTGIDGNISRYKARLVARGFRQLFGIDFFDTYSPVATAASIRIFWATAAANDMVVTQGDAITAFLNAEVDEEIYLTQPEGFVVTGKEDKVGRALKAIYGLKQAGRKWYLTLRSILINIGFRPTNSDPCVFVRSGQILVVIVDDMAIATLTMEDADRFWSELEARFKIKRLGEPKKFLGQAITRDRAARTISISQKQYALEILDQFGFTDARPVSTPMFVGQRFEEHAEAFDPGQYQAAIGSLLHLSTQTRPDLAQALGVLSRYNSAPTIEHWSAVGRVFRYLRGTYDYSLTRWYRSHRLHRAVTATTSLLADRPPVTCSSSDQAPSLGHPSANRLSPCLPPKLNTWLLPTPLKKPFGFQVFYRKSALQGTIRFTSKVITRAPSTSPRTPSSILALSTSTCGTTSSASASTTVISLSTTFQQTPWSPTR